MSFARSRIVVLCIFFAAVAFVVHIGVGAQTKKWIQFPARFADSEYWSHSDAPSGAEIRLKKQVDPGDELIQAVRTWNDTPALVNVLRYDGMDNTGITIRVYECLATIALNEAYRKFSQQPMYQRPNGRVDVIFAAYAAANLQDCMDTKSSRTYRLPSPPVSTYINIDEGPFDVTITQVGGTRLAVRHRQL